MKPLSPALEAYALRTHHYGRISGISLGAHAVSDAFLLLHGGVGCKYKAAAQISVHDWGRQPHRREGWTEVGDAALIRGAAQRIGPYVRSWYDRQKPGLMLVTTASFLEMVGEDIAAEVRQAAATVPCPVRYLPGLGFEGDLYEGYAAVLREVAALVDWEHTRPKPGTVAIVGYFFDRYEADHAANIHQLRALCHELGLSLEAVLPSGQPLAQLQRAAGAETVVLLPYAHVLQPQLEATGRHVVRTDLPVSIRGTAAWLRKVGRGAGVDAERVEKTTERLSHYTRSQVEMLRSRVVGHRSALFADPPLAAGLYGLLEEVGIPPHVVGLRGRTLGGRTALTDTLARFGAPLRDDVEVLEDPSFLHLRNHLPQRIHDQKIIAVLGSSAELGVLKNLQDDGLAGPLSGEGSPLRGLLAVGFPNSGGHVIHPQPTYGFGGAVALAQRLLDALL